MTTIKCNHFKTEADVELTCISKCAFCRRPGKNHQCPDLASWIESNEAACAEILSRATTTKPFREAFPDPTAAGVAAARAGTATKVATAKPAASPSNCSPYVATAEDLEDTAKPEVAVPEKKDRALAPAAGLEISGVNVDAPAPTPPPMLTTRISALKEYIPCPPKEVLEGHPQPAKRERAIKNSFVIFVETAPGTGLFTMNDIDIRDLVTYTMAGRRVIAAPEASEF